MDRRGWKLKQDKVDVFLKELAELEEKHGMEVSADTLGIVDYDIDDEPFTTHIAPVLQIVDKQGRVLRVFNVEGDDS
jgi:hypothetical protein